MYISLVISTLFLSVFHVNSVTICDECVCRYETRTDQDLHGENVDCSYNAAVIAANYSLPSTVRAMDLSANNLTRVRASSLLRSKTMQELSLNNNEIVQIDANALELPELRRLDLSDNRLEVIYEDTFKNIKKLQMLNLASNKFTTFAKLTFHHLSNLNEVVLDNNDIGPTLRHINIFDRNGYGLTHKIRSLSISGINLTMVPDNFYVDAYDLKRLVISNNHLSDIFEIPFTLEYLDLSDNPIRDMYIEDFIDLPGLKELKLNNLQISEVSDYVFSALRGLVSLELERNRNLVNFSALAFGHEVLDDPDNFLLQKLSLRGSRLTTFDEQLLEPLGQLSQLNLQGNPWHCDCKLMWIKKLQIQPKDYEHLRCATPKQLLNKRIFDLDTRYFVCPAARRLTAVAVAVAALCVSLAAAALWLVLCLPKRQTRCRVVQGLYAQSAAYSVLPMTAARDIY